MMKTAAPRPIALTGKVRRLASGEEIIPLIEQTAAGAQTVIPGTEGRTIPNAPLRPKRAQTEAPMELEQPAIRAKEPGLFEKPTPTPESALSTEEIAARSEMRAELGGATRGPTIKEAAGQYRQPELPESSLPPRIEQGLFEEPSTAPKRSRAPVRSDVVYARRTGAPIREDLSDVELGDIVYDSLLERYGQVKEKLNGVVRVTEGNDSWTIGVGNRLQGAERIGQQLSLMSMSDLIKKGIGSETGAVGKLTPEQARIEAEARAARKEIYRRLVEQAAKTGESIEAVADRLKVPPGALRAIQAEQEGTGGGGGGRLETSIKNAQVDRELADMGLPPATHGERMSFDDANIKAEQLTALDPFAGQKLIDELVGNMRPANKVEVALLTREWTRLTNERIQAEMEAMDAQKLGDPIAINEAKARVDKIVADVMTTGNVLAQTGTESSLSLGHRRMMMKEDYSLAAMERTKSVGKGRSLTEAERAEVKTLYEKINATQKAFDDYMAKAEAQRSDLESKLAHSRILIEAKEKPPIIEVPPQVKSLADRIVSVLDTEANLARARLREKLGRLSAGLDPTIIADMSIIGAAKLARGALDFTRWSKEMIADLGEKIQPYLQPVWDAANKRLDDRVEKMAGPKKEAVKRVVRGMDAAEKRDTIKGQIKTKMDEGKPADIPILATKLARLHVEEGIRERNALIDAVHADLQDIAPDITRRETMDAISGYGQYKQLTKDEISVELRDLKGQMQQVAKLEDIQNREPPLKTGIERRTPSDEERRLIQQVNEAKRRFGIVVTDPATQLQSALGARKTYYRNQISDLEAQIQAKEKFVKEKTPSPTDPELENLKAQRDELKKEFDSIFEKPGLTEQQRLDAAIRGAERSIAELDRQIETGDIFPRHRKPPPPTSPELEALRRQVEVRKLRRDAMREVNDPGFTREETLLKGLAKRIDTLENQVQTGDVQARARPERFTTDLLEKVRARRDALTKQVRDLREAARTPEEIQARGLATLKTRLQNETAKLQDKLERGDFSKKPARRVVQMDAEANRLSFEAARVKAQHHEALMRDRLANRSTGEKIIAGLGEAMNTTRSIITSIDLSAVLRQGGFIGFGHPLRAFQALPSMFKALASEAGRYAVDQEILGRRNYQLYTQSKLYLAEHGQKLSQMEEHYMSRWADKIPGVAASERAYTTFLNRLRADSFDAMTKSLGRSGEVTPEEGKAIANFINVATGRGEAGAKANALVALNTVFFAPRYVLSRFQLLAGQPMYQGSVRTRTMIAGEYGRALTGLGLVYGLAKMAGAEIETDSRSSDFGKIRFGNTRVDPLMGLSQTSVLLSRLFTGQTKSLTGKVTPIRGDRVPYGGANSADIMARFLRTKLSPVVGQGVNILSGKDVVGNQVTPESVAAGLVVPLAMQDIYQAMQDQGVPKGTALGLLATFGMGLQTFNPYHRPAVDRRPFLRRWDLAQGQAEAIAASR